MNEQERHDCEGVENSADIDDAWVRLILTRHAPSVGGWLRSRYAILTAEDVEDIVVIAMIRLWKVRDRFDAARASLRTYFVHRRQRGSEPDFERLGESETVGSAAAYAGNCRGVKR